jgi:Antitoxin Phd_YefM, type II toxin-antitoxin system
MLRKQPTKRHQGDVWQFQEAKAQLSKVMDTVQETGMQTIIRNRDEVYIVMSQEQFEKCTRPKDSLLDFFMNAPCPDVDLDITRSEEGIREVDL